MVGHEDPRTVGKSIGTRTISAGYEDTQFKAKGRQVCVRVRIRVSKRVVLRFSKPFI